MIWDASRDGSPGSLMKLEGHQLTVIQIIFNQSSDRILTVGRDRIAIIWKLDGNEWVKEQVFGKGNESLVTTPSIEPPILYYI